MIKSRFFAFYACLFLIVSNPLFAQPVPAQEIALQFDPALTTAEITLPATLHTVEGKFLFKRGALHYDPATGKATGELVFDATSGDTGNSSRDHKMHKDILESQRHPEIAFRPDHAEGTFSPTGASTLQVHGQFSIHGADHDLTVPVEIKFVGNHWTADAKFPIPYRQWGMKSPNTLVLHVADTVEVHLRCGGTAAP